MKVKQLYSFKEFLQRRKNTGNGILKLSGELDELHKVEYEIIKYFSKSDVQVTFDNNVLNVSYANFIKERLQTFLQKNKNVKINE